MYVDNLIWSRVILIHCHHRAGSKASNLDKLLFCVCRVADWWHLDCTIVTRASHDSGISIYTAFSMATMDNSRKDNAIKPIHLVITAFSHFQWCSDQTGWYKFAVCFKFVHTWLLENVHIFQDPLLKECVNDQNVLDTSKPRGFLSINLQSISVYNGYSHYTLHACLWLSIPTGCMSLVVQSPIVLMSFTGWFQWGLLHFYVLGTSIYILPDSQRWRLLLLLL